MYKWLEVIFVTNKKENGKFRLSNRLMEMEIVQHLANNYILKPAITI